MLSAIFRNRTTRTLFLFFLVIISISTFFLVFGYRNELKLLEEQRLERLKGIATTMGIQINGDEHEVLITTMMKQKDSNPFENDHYTTIQKQLSSAQNANNVESAIYTLFYHPDKNTFCYGVRSDSSQALFEEYKKFPDDLLRKMYIGGTLPKYKTETGTWISAFYPVKNSMGKTVALIEVDEKFSHFRKYADQQLYRFLGISLAGLVLLSAIIFPSLRKIIQRDTKLYTDLALQKKTLENYNKNMTTSVQYASYLQRVLMPESEELKENLSDSFIFYKPKDIISGDFYWFFENDNAFYIALADGTGHGVPGAIMSVMGIVVLNSILSTNPTIEPDALLTQLDKEINRLMSSSNRSHSRNDGMDIGVCKIDKTDKSVKFSGANMDLYCISEKGDLSEIKGHRFPIGGDGLYEKTRIDTYNVENPFKGSLYLFSDGFKDQFGGEKGKKFGTKQLLGLLTEINHLSGDEQLEKLKSEFNEWIKQAEQVDDVSVLGFRV